MLDFFGKTVAKLFGSKAEKDLKDVVPYVALINAEYAKLTGLTDDQLREVIQEPAYRAGLQIEQGLTDTILADVERKPGNLPLLQHALLETWRNKRGTMLTLEGYRATGGVQHGLSERAEAVFEALSAIA